MKNFFGLTIVTLCFLSGLRAASTYNITSNAKWNTAFSSYCGSCIINISSGITLTLNNASTCDNCTITGGILMITGDFSFQSTSISNTSITTTVPITLNNTNSFNNVTAVFRGSSSIASNGALTISNSSFTFSNTSSFTSNAQLNLDNSHIYFNDNSNFTSNSSTVNLKNASEIVAGDGSKSSKASLTFYGQLNLVDASSLVIISNVNNYYLSWNTYTSASNGATYTTTNNNKNCGGAGQNACSAANYFGGAVLSNKGPLPISILPTIVDDFSYVMNSNKTVKLSWTLSEVSGESYFQVERSNNAQDFVPMTNMGVEQSTTSYSYTDESPVSGQNDYRIKITGVDGTIIYSKIISAQITETNNLHIFPNPSVGGNIQVQFSNVQSAMLSVFTTDGRLVYMNSLSGQAQYAVHIPSTEHTGLLVVRIATKDKTSSFTLLNNQ